MAISRLVVNQVRNLADVDIAPSSHINLIFGENGSGKTSLLEAVYLLGMGRSFRSLKHKAVIQREKDSLSVFARLKQEDSQEIPVAIQRNQEGGILLKAYGQKLNSVAELAFLLPVQVIDAEAFLLLEGSPRSRRQFLDWLVFHVEPAFYSVWRDSQKCLKQRNILLRRDKIDQSEIQVWDKELIRLSDQVNTYREARFEEFKSFFFKLVEDFIHLENLKISYFSGWEKGRPYAEALAGHWERDKQQGFTQSGVHRADLRITLAGQNAAEVLSRGQQKLLVCALKIAQGLMYQQLTGKSCIFLVDDLPAELDRNHRKTLIHWLRRLKTQVFVTGVEIDQLSDAFLAKDSADLGSRDFVRFAEHDEHDEQEEGVGPVKKFHVELGKVSEVA